MTETFELDSAEAKEAAKQLHLGWFTSGGFLLYLACVNGFTFPPRICIYIYMYIVCIVYTCVYICIYIVAYRDISGSIRSEGKIASSR